MKKTFTFLLLSFFALSSIYSQSYNDNEDIGAPNLNVPQHGKRTYNLGKKKMSLLSATEGVFQRDYSLYIPAGQSVSLNLMPKDNTKLKFGVITSHMNFEGSFKILINGKESASLKTQKSLDDESIVFLEQPIALLAPVSNLVLVNDSKVGINLKGIILESVALD